MKYPLSLVEYSPLYIYNIYYLILTITTTTYHVLGNRNCRMGNNSPAWQRKLPHGVNSIPVRRYEVSAIARGILAAIDI